MCGQLNNPLERNCIATPGMDSSYNVQNNEGIRRDIILGIDVHRICEGEVFVFFLTIVYI